MQIENFRWQMGGEVRVENLQSAIGLEGQRAGEQMKWMMMRLDIAYDRALS